MSLRDRFATCPRCKAGLDERNERWVCGGCGGLLITEAAVSQMIADMLGDQVSANGWSGKVAMPEPLALEPRSGGEDLTCPRCATTMTAVSLYGIPLDRCGEHGLWFDKRELEQVLAQSTIAHPPPRPTSERVFGTVVLAVTIAAELLRLIALRG